MLLTSVISSAVGGILVLCSISGVAAQSGAGEPPRSGWYVGGGIGSNWASDLDQEGWNVRDTSRGPDPARVASDGRPLIA